MLISNLLMSALDNANKKSYKQKIVEKGAKTKIWRKKKIQRSGRKL